VRWVTWRSFSLPLTWGLAIIWRSMMGKANLWFLKKTTRAYVTFFSCRDTPSGTPLATYTGSNIPPHVGYPVSSIFLQFTSDGSGEGQGFTITYHAGSYGIQYGRKIIINPLIIVGGCTTTAEVHGDALGVVRHEAANIHIHMELMLCYIYR